MKRKIAIVVSSVVVLTALLGGIEALLLQDIPLLGFCIAFVTVSYAAIRSRNRLLPRDPRTTGRWFKRQLVGIGLLCAVWLALFASLYLFPAFFISTKPTYITEPRLKDRYGVDFLAHFERDIPHEDNAAPQISAALWARGEEEEYEPAVRFVHYHYFTRELPQESRTILAARGHALSDGVSLPCSDEEREILQPWFESNEPAFALFEEALQKPFFMFRPSMLKSSYSW